MGIPDDYYADQFARNNAASARARNLADVAHEAEAVTPFVDVAWRDY
jgi:hypothetical protein